MEIKVDALVLRTADYGESDRMLTLFTLQRGKLSAACKGVRKAGAKLRFAAQPFCFAEYVLAVRGERATVISAANTDGFYGLRSSVEKLYAAASLAAVCDALLFDGIVNEALFLYAVDALRSMCEGNEAGDPHLLPLAGARSVRLSVRSLPMRGLRRARRGAGVFRRRGRRLLLRGMRARRGRERGDAAASAQVRGDVLPRGGDRARLGQAGAQTAVRGLSRPHGGGRESAGRVHRHSLKAARLFMRRASAAFF